MRGGMFAGAYTDLARGTSWSPVQGAVASTIAHGTHLEALAWAAGQLGPGAVLEVGSGYWSTPWLHGWCEAQDRWLLTVETEAAWAVEMRKLFADEGHEVRVLPRGHAELPEDFALVLIDGISEDRALWLDALEHTRARVVLHDTEPGREIEFPGEAAALDRFTYRRDFRRVYPWTTVVWNGEST
jgi:hypothetical protein